MRPRITCHMVTSIDGRLHPDRWSDPADGTVADLLARHYDSTAERLEGEGWIVGRKTMAEYVDEAETPDLDGQAHARPPHAGRRDGRDVAVAIDPSGRLRFASDEVDGDHAVAVLSERVPDATLDRLRETGVSYLFAGADGGDLDAALKTLGETFGIGHLILEGGARTNGAFLAAGLIDEVSTLICPAIDGLSGIPSIFEHPGPSGSRPAERQHLRLLGCETLDGGVIWLRHDVVRG